MALEYSHNEVVSLSFGSVFVVNLGLRDKLEFL